MPRSLSYFDHPEAKPLMQAILANPEDDAIRLVMADWLEEHGHGQRAEFIRIQVELARLADGDPERQSLLHRAGELESGPGRRWRFQEQQASCVLTTVYDRGFLGEVHGATVAKWLKSAAGLFRLAPIRVASVFLYGLRLRDFAASPCLARLSRLHLIAFSLRDDQADWFADSASLAAIPSVVIENFGANSTRMSAKAEKRLRTSFGTRLQLRASQ